MYSAAPLPLVVGSHLDRAVLVCSERAIGAVEIRGAVVMLTASSATPPELIEQWLHALVSAAPGAIVVAGAAASLFERLLHILSTAGGPHIMTGVEPEVAVAIESTLRATWPAEERFDEWSKYVLVVLGDETMHEHVVQLATSLIG